MKINKKLNFHIILIVMIWCQTILMEYVRGVILRVPILGNYPNVVIAALYAGMIFLAFRQLTFSVRDVYLYVLFSLVYCASFFLFSNTRSYWKEEAISFALQTLPLYFVGVIFVSNEKDRDRTLDWMYYASMATIVLNFIYKALLRRGAHAFEGGDMDNAYKLLPHVCLVLYFAFKKPTVWNIASSLLGISFLFFLGTRGAAFIGLSFAVVCFVFLPKKKEKVYVRLGMLAVLMAMLFIPPIFTFIIKTMASLAGKLGFSVRIFNQILEGGLTISSGREKLMGTVYAEIMRKPFLIRGIYSDRVVLEGLYVHNVILELWHAFGIPFGSILFLAIITLPIIAWKKAKDEKLRGLILVLFFGCITKLMLSGSYLREPLLFFLFGICSAVLRKGKEKESILQEKELNDEKDTVD